MSGLSYVRTEEEVAEYYGWSTIPKSFVSKEGVCIDSSGDVWVLPVYNSPTYELRFNEIGLAGLKWVLKEYLRKRVETTSSISGYNAFGAIRTLIIRKLDYSATSLESELIRVYEDMISNLREKQSLWRAYLPIRWYVWAADRYPEVGFNQEYANVIDAIELGGNPKGQAIKSDDEEEGPLTTLEFKVLLKSLKDDCCPEYVSFQQRAALALYLAIGRNSENLTYLRESDLENLAPEGVAPCYTLKVPRIKKGFISPRDDFIVESLDESIAKFLLELIEENKKNKHLISADLRSQPLPDTLFVKPSGNRAARSLSKQENILNMTTHEMRDLLIAFVKRNNVISPVTKKLLRITPRRLRYTFGTNMVGEGVSRKELARMLDHSDTQSVGVYFRLAGRIVEHLDKALAKQYASVLDMFKGRVVLTDDDAVNGDCRDKHLHFYKHDDSDQLEEIGVCGEANVCHLDPPYSCYLCAKFQPYAHADHEQVLSVLLDNREEKLKKYESKRLGVQLDDVIMAVAKVVEKCEEVKNGS